MICIHSLVDNKWGGQFLQLLAAPAFLLDKTTFLCLHKFFCYVVSLLSSAPTFLLGSHTLDIHNISRGVLPTYNTYDAI